MSHNTYSLRQFSELPARERLLYLSTSVYEGDWAGMVHTHPITELFYIINGMGIFEIDGVEQPVKQYDLLLINPNIPHTEKAFQSQAMEYAVLGIDGLTLNVEDGTYFLDSFEAYKDELLNYLNLMITESEREQTGSDAVCQHLLAILLLLLQRKSGLYLVADKQMQPQSQQVPPECSRVKSYIDSYSSRRITLPALARIAGWDKYYLSHAFTRAYGISPINYLLEKRLDRARELLANSNHTVTGIAQMLGFSSQSYFAQLFKKKFGITASEYRKQAQSSEKTTVAPAYRQRLKCGASAGMARMTVFAAAFGHLQKYCGLPLSRGSPQYF